MTTSSGYRKIHARDRDPRTIARVASMVEEGASDTQIARRLGTSREIVRSVRRIRLDNLPGGSTFRLSPGGVARQLGVSNNVVRRWISQGILPAKGPVVKARKGEPVRRRIDEEDVLAFLANPAHWHEWRVEDIADPDLREWAAALNRPRYLTVAEVAERMCVERHTVSWWIGRGLLPGARSFAGGRVWRIPEGDLASFRLPSERPIWETRSGCWSPEHDAILREGLEALAKQLGRTAGACAQRFKVLRAEDR